MAEEGWTDNEIAKLAVKEYLKNFKENQMDALILGCTHYPLYENIIKAELPDTEIINTGKIIADYIAKTELVSNQKAESDEIYLTDTECNFLNVAKNILKQEIEIKKL